MSDTPPVPPAPRPQAASPGPIKFPPRPPPERILSLRRRLALQPAAMADEARKSINAIMAATRAPWGEQQALTPTQVDELQRTLRQLETKLEERELAVGDLVAK